MKSYLFYRHQNKEQALEKALLAAGWKEDKSLAGRTAAFFDHDIMGRDQIFEQLKQRNALPFVYPHAGRPSVFYSWKHWEPSKHTTAMFVPAHGHVDVLRSIGYPHPLHVTGWSLCEVKPYHNCGRVRNVLFAPLHPNANHWLSECDRKTNQEAFARLLKASKEMSFQITVRHLDKLENNGLQKEHISQNVRYVQGRPDTSFCQIDEADVVVATQTFLYLAVARGKPAIAMDENIPPKGGNSNENFSFINPEHWEKIKGDMMFPLDINDTDDVNDLIFRSTRRNDAVQKWTERMIGERFHSDRFVRQVEQYW